MKDKFFTQREYDKKYNKDYYKKSCDIDGQLAYDLGNPQWNNYFTELSHSIKDAYDVKSIMDVGCARGFLVGKLRNLNINAFGVDVSSYAISMVEVGLQEYCIQGSILDEDFIKGLGRYDLVTCIEVLEHLPEASVEIAIHNLTLLSDNIYFSSSPDNFNEETHLNVKPPDYWVELFKKNGYYLDFRKNISVIPHSLCFIKKEHLLLECLALPVYINHFKSLYGQTFDLQKIKRGDINFDILYRIFTYIRNNENRLQSKIENNTKLDILEQKLNVLEQDLSKSTYEDNKNFDFIIKKLDILDNRLFQSISLISNYNNSIKMLEGENANLKEELNKSNNSLLNMTNVLDNIYSSTTWKLYLLYARSKSLLKHIITFNRFKEFSFSVKSYGNKITNPVHDKLKYCLIIYFSEDNPQRYRGILLQEQFHKLGYSCDIFKYDNSELSQNISKYHIVIFQRCPINLEIDKLFKKIINTNIVTIYDIDDLVFSSEYAKYNNFLKGSTMYEFYATLDHYNRNFSLINMCNFILTTTEQLKEEINKKLKKNNVYINRNAMGNDILYFSSAALQEKSLYNKPKNSFFIGYASGSATHNEDFKIIEDALIKILKRYKNVYLVILGELVLSDRFTNLNVMKVPTMPWRNLPFWLSQFDINLAPLESNIFCTSKSELKYFEAGAVKVPTVASAVGPFIYAIQDRVNGVLCHTSKQWFDSLSTLINDKKLRKSIAQNAYNHSLSNYVTSVRAINLSKILKDIRQKMDLKHSVLKINWFINVQNNNSINNQNILNIISNIKADFDCEVYYLEQNQSEVRISDISIACDFRSAYFIMNNIENTNRKVFLSSELEYKQLNVDSKEYTLAKSVYSLNIYNIILDKKIYKKLKSEYMNSLFQIIDVKEQANTLYTKECLNHICNKIISFVTDDYI